jgi:hypothetical protein
MVSPRANKDVSAFKQGEVNRGKYSVKLISVMDCTTRTKTETRM